MRVRPVTEADAAILAVLNAHVHDLHVAAEPRLYRPTDSEEVEAWLRETLGAGRSEGLIAFENDEPLGQVIFSKVEHAGHALVHPHAYLMVDQIAVVPGFRRRGVGRALMEAVAERARALGLTQVQLDVRVHNDGARAFYESLGFGEVQRRLGLEV